MKTETKLNWKRDKTIEHTKAYFAGASVFVCQRNDGLWEARHVGTFKTLKAAKEACERKGGK